MLRSILNSKGVESLNKTEQLLISGGVPGGNTYYCVCSGSVGEWYGTYSSQSAAEASLETWCASETGDCYHMQGVE